MIRFSALDIQRVAHDAPGVAAVVARVSAVETAMRYPGTPPDTIALAHDLPEAELVEHAELLGWTWDGARWQTESRRKGKPLWPVDDDLVAAIERRPWWKAERFAKRWQAAPYAVVQRARRAGKCWCPETLNKYGKPGFWIDCEPANG